MPGEALAAGSLNVCLGFDDGYYDFHARVFPLLKKHRLRALLAIPPYFIREYVDRAPGDRLEVDTDAAFEHPSTGGFCTWLELEEMVGSGHVMIAAQGYSHRRLDAPDIDLETEVHAPQTILSARFSQRVESFVFSNGKFSRRALQSARQRYRFVFANGGACNHGWDQPVLYRIDADELVSPGAPFSPARLLRYRAIYWWKHLRGC
jgi:peptidoglycan/xylan/chitin deacetylase (PgdA/CDA1 family)